jgi:hypothetical protein
MSIGNAVDESASRLGLRLLGSPLEVGPDRVMNKWHIASSRDDAFGIAEAAKQIAMLVGQLHSALGTLGSAVLVWELEENSRSVGRAAIQAHVDHDFFEQFFNSSDGYRAMFRRGRRIGCAVNAALIDLVASVLRHNLPESVASMLVEKTGDTLRVVGRKAIERRVFLRSLDPSLAKIWFATAELSFEGPRQLSFGVGDATIDVGLEYRWKKIEQDPGNCIIEIKGAFVGPSGLYQKKDPEERAAGLSTTGGA